MKEFVETLICRLEEKKDSVPVNRLLDDIIKDKPKELGQLMAYDNAIEIVNQLAEEYNNGWIPCSERLPDDFMSMAYLTTVKGHFYPEVKYYCVANHKWYSNERTTKEVNVIAWMPLPVAFRKGE